MKPQSPNRNAPRGAPAVPVADVRQNTLLSLRPMKTKAIITLSVAAIAAFAQSGSPNSTSDAKAKERERTLSEARTLERSLAIRRQLDALRKDEQSRVFRMPGTGKTIEEKLVFLLAEEVLSLQEQTQALQKQVAALSAK